MNALEMIDDSNFEEFLSAPAVLLFVGKEGCGPCMEWTQELKNELTSLDLPGVRFGKLALGEGKHTNFKRVHGVWLSHLRELPYNSLWVNGAIVKEWPGGGFDRLTSRLQSLGLMG